MAFVITSSSDFLEDIEVEVEQLSPNFIIAGYYKVPSLPPAPPSPLLPLRSPHVHPDLHQPAAAFQRLLPPQGHTPHCRPALRARGPLQESEGVAACASKQTRLDATRRRVCIRVATGLNRRVRDVPMAALLHASVRVAVKNLLLLPRVVGSVWLQQRHVQRTCRQH